MNNGRVIKGQIQSTGAYITNYMGNEYVHVTMIHDDGKIEQLKSVTVPSVVGAFFHAGVKGEFYFHHHGKRNTLLAMKSNGRSIFSLDDAKRVWRHHIQTHGIMLFIAAFFLLILILDNVLESAGLTPFALVAFLIMAFFTFKTRIGARYLRPKNAEKLIRDLGF